MEVRKVKCFFFFFLRGLNHNPQFPFVEKLLQNSFQGYRHKLQFPIFKLTDNWNKYFFMQNSPIRCFIHSMRSTLENVSSILKFSVWQHKVLKRIYFVCHEQLLSSENYNYLPFEHFYSCFETETE